MRVCLTASAALEGPENNGETPTEEEWSFAFSSGVLCDSSNGLSVKQEGDPRRGVRESEILIGRGEQPSRTLHLCTLPYHKMPYSNTLGNKRCPNTIHSPLMGLLS